MNTITERLNTKIEISNNCCCVYCPACSISSDSPERFCAECGGEFQTTTECLGCYEVALEDFRAIVGEWLESVGNPYEVLIHGQKMGWRGASGYVFARGNPSAILKTLTLDSEWRLKLNIDDESFTARRWSHDEPTGSPTFVIVPALPCVECGESVLPDSAVLDIDGVARCYVCSNVCASCGVQDHDCGEGSL